MELLSVARANTDVSDNPGSEPFADKGIMQSVLIWLAQGGGSAASALIVPEL